MKDFMEQVSVEIVARVLLSLFVLLSGLGSIFADKLIKRINVILQRFPQIRSLLAQHWAKLTGALILSSVVLVFLVGVWGVLPLIFSLTAISLYLRRSYLQLLHRISKGSKELISIMKKLSKLIMEVAEEAKKQELKEILSDIAALLDVDHQYEYYKMIYVMENKPEDDQWSRDFEIVDTEDDIVVLKKIFFGASGPGFKYVREFDELKLQMTTSKGSIEILDISEKVDQDRQVKMWTGDIMFTEPIAPGERRKVRISGRWPHLWDKLREEGKDEDCDFTLLKDCRELQIILTFPRGVEKAELIRRQPQDAGEVNTTRDRSHRLQRIWKIENAKPGTYSYIVYCSDCVSKKKNNNQG